MKKPYCHYVICARFDKKESNEVLFYMIEGPLTFVLSELRRIKKEKGMNTYIIEEMNSFPDLKEKPKQKSSRLNYAQNVVKVESCPE